VQTEKRVNVLIVDDSKTARFMLARVLEERFGATVTEAANGREALEHLAKGAFEFVMLDVGMPVMNGFETLRTIRGTPRLATLPVLMLTAEKSEAVVREIIQLGISAYLSKPLTRDAIAERVSYFLAQPRRPGNGHGTACPATHPDVSLQLDTAVEQLFGLMLSLDIEREGVALPAPADQMVAHVEIVADAQPPLDMTLTCAVDTARSLSASLTDSVPSVQTESSMLASLREMANIIAGRVRNSLKDRHELVYCTLPDARRVANATGWPAHVQGHHCGGFFRVRNSDLTFHLDVACRGGAC
jgi:two-component system chemotaxis response regulator CheY